MAKSKFLKNLLTTASAVAVLAGGVQSAAANQRTTAVGAAVLEGPVNIAAFADNDAIKMGVAFGISVGANGHSADSLDLNGNNGQTFTVDHNLSIGSVADALGPNTAKIKFVVADKTLTFTGKSAVANTGVAANIYTGVSAVELNNAASKHVISTAANVDIAATINSTAGANNGALIVNPSAVNASTTFNGAIGTAVNGKLASITVGVENGKAATAIFNAQVKSGILNVGGASANANDGANGTATFAVGAVDSEFTTINLGGVGAGTNAGGVGTASFGNVKADVINVGGVGINAGGANGGAGVLTLTGSISDNGGNSSDIKVGGATVGAGIGGAATVNLTGTTGKAVLTFANTVAANVINLDGANFTGAIDAAGAGKGVVNVLNNDSTIKSKIGSANGNAVAAINFTTGKTLTVDSNNDAGFVKTTLMTFDKDGGKLIVTNTGNLNAAALNQDITFGAGGLTLAKDNNASIRIHKSVGTKSSVTIAGTIGDLGAVGTAKGLESLIIEEGVGSDGVGTYVTLSANGTHQVINELGFAGASNLRLVGGTFQINKFNNVPGPVSLTLETQDSTISSNNAAGLSVGTAENPLAFIKFIANKALKIGDVAGKGPVSIYASKLDQSVDDQGKIEFVGTGTLSAPLGKSDGGGNPVTVLAEIKGPGLGYTGTILTDVKTVDVDSAILVGAGTLAFGGNITANAYTNTAIRGGGAGAGTLQFVNKAAIIVEDKIGNGGLIGTIQLSGADVTFNRTVTHANAANKIVFDSQADTATNAIFTVDALNLTGVKISSTAKVTPTLQFSSNGNDVTFGSVGSNAQHLVNLELAGDGSTNVQTDAATALQFANIRTTVANTNKIEFTNGTKVAPALVNSFGTADKPLLLAEFSTFGTVTGDAYSKEFTVMADQTATFNGMVSAGKNPLAGAVLSLANGAGPATTNVVLNDGSTLDIALTSDGANTTVTLGSGKGGTVGIQKDIEAGKLTSGKSILTFSDDTNNNARNLNGNFTATGTTLDLGTTNVTVTGATVAPALVLEKHITIKTAVTSDSTTVTGGNIVVANTTGLNIGALTDVNVVVDDSNLTNLDLINPVTFTVLKSNPNNLTGSARPVFINGLPVFASGTNSLTSLTGTMVKPSQIDVTITNNATKVTTADLSANGGTTADIENAAVLTSSPGVFKILAKITDSSKRAELIKRATAVDSAAVVADINSRIGDSLVARMDNLAGLQGTPATSRVVGDAGTSGISAGDDAHRFGAWVSPFFGKTSQKARDDAAGYNADTVGANFGFDTRANDDMIVGVSAAVLGTNVKYKNYKSGDKAKVNSMMFSVYGMQQISNNWFAEGVVTFGSSKVNTTEKRVTGNTTYATVKGDYSSTSFGGEGFFGYSFVAMNDYVVTPMIGARYTKINDGGYTETGNTAAQLLSVAKKSTNKFEGIIGGRVAGGKFDLGSMAVTPEIHGFVSQDMIGKSAKTTMKLSDGSVLPNAKNAKVIKTFYNVGFGLNAEQGMAEYGVGYDAHIAAKHIGHQGTLKVRVNF